MRLPVCRASLPVTFTPKGVLCNELSAKARTAACVGRGTHPAQDGSLVGSRPCVTGSGKYSELSLADCCAGTEESIASLCACSLWRCAVCILQHRNIVWTRLRRRNFEEEQRSQKARVLSGCKVFRRRTTTCRKSTLMNFAAIPK